jgi:hypothetical protein
VVVTSVTRTPRSPRLAANGSDLLSLAILAFRRPLALLCLQPTHVVLLPVWFWFRRLWLLLLLLLLLLV